MARRARQGLSPIQITCIAVGLAGLGLAAIFTFSSSLFSPDNSLRSVSELNISNYITSGTSMGGTVWRVTGTVDEKLRWTRDRGQVVSVYIEQGSTKESLPIVVPESFKDLSINVGDRFTFKVEVAEKQFLIARDLIRS